MHLQTKRRRVDGAPDCFVRSGWIGRPVLRAAYCRAVRRYFPISDELSLLGISGSSLPKRWRPETWNDRSEVGQRPQRGHGVLREKAQRRRKLLESVRSNDDSTRARAQTALAKRASQASSV